MPALKRKKTGVVVSNKMDKTVLVEVGRRIKHPHFKKYYLKTKKFKVHDEKNACQIGDKVEISESKPISRDKHWVVTSIQAKGNGGGDLVV